MNSHEVTAELHISRTTLQRLVAEGHLAPVHTYNPLLKRQPPYRFWRADVERLKQTPPDRRAPGRPKD